MRPDSMASALALRDCVTARRMTEAGRSPSQSERASWRRNSSYAALMCVRAVDRLHDPCSAYIEHMSTVVFYPHVVTHSGGNPVPVRGSCPTLARVIEGVIN